MKPKPLTLKHQPATPQYEVWSDKNGYYLSFGADVAGAYRASALLKENDCVREREQMADELKNLLAWYASLSEPGLVPNNAALIAILRNAKNLVGTE